jgi:nucleoside-diphosphate-sugar epimerase
MTTSRVALLTGATGFVGSHLARRLVRDGWSVCALTRPPLDRLPSGVEPVEIPGSPDALIRSVDAVAPTVCFHLATRFQGHHEPVDVPDLVEANVGFGAQLAEAVARTSRCPFVNVGSAWQRFEGRVGAPTTLYAATKQAFEDILTFYAQVEGLPVATLYFFDTYGPDDRRQKLVPLLFDAARRGRELEMSGGHQLIDLLHVDDAVSALLAVAELLRSGEGTGEGGGAGFAARTGAPVTVRELVELVEQATARSLRLRWGARPYRPREMFTPWLSPPPPPGWSPTIALADGLRALAEDHR